MLTAWGVLFCFIGATVPGSDLYEQARAAEAKARYADAAGTYQAASDAGGPLAPYARVRSAVCRAIAGDLAGGASELDAIIASDAGTAWAALAAHERALLYIRENNRAEAAALFAQAHVALTDLWWLEDIRWMAAENALALPGHEADAIVFFQAAANSSPWGKKRYEAAKLLATTPALENQLAAVIYLVNSGASNEAEPLLQSIPEFGPDAATLQRLRDRAQGRVDVARGRSEAGLDRLWKVGSDPAAREIGLDALLDIVNHHARLREFREGERAMARLVALEPTAPQTIAGHKALAASYAREALPEAAERHFLAVIGASVDPREKQGTLLNAANAYRQQGRAREALERFTTLIEQYPKGEAGVEAAYWAGAILYQAGADRNLVIERFRSAADHGVSTYYGHRAADLLAQLGDRDRPRARELSITPDEPILRPIDLAHEKPVNALEQFKDDERIARLAFFAARGYPEAEWEALAIGNTLHSDPAPDMLYLALGEAGATAYTAMQFAAANAFGDNGDGSQSLTRLRIRYPRAYWEQVTRLGREVGVDPYLILAIARQESTYRPGLTSIAGAQGVMQLMPATASWLVKTDARVPPTDAEQLNDPRSSLRLGAHYIRLMLDRYEDNLVYALAAYNGGPGNCDTWKRNFRGNSFAEFIEFIPFTETRNYVKRVLANYVTYHSIYPPAD